MYALSVRDHVMIAHSLKGDVFGPARQLHGATYVVDAEFRRSHLDADGLVLDIGLAGRLLKEVLAPLNYRNLDELPDFQGRNTTTEALSRHVFVGLRNKLVASGVALGENGLDHLKITLHESHVAWASYEGALVAD
ncbi:MAG: 6-carboxytetrahydropterin synthase [Alphaproteobacteria bacterium]|nr:6-carboxytetrahydropterin synthase [Alphaproteobacteria bacterium]